MIQEIQFKNDAGVINISGGENPLLELTSLSGLTLPEKEITLAVFKNIAGQKLISSRDKSRTIKIEGLLKGNLPLASHVLYSMGTLTIKNEHITRVTDARCTHISDRNTEGKISIIFQCDSPYFHDDTDLTAPVYSRIKLVSSPFVLPCVFTRRVREGNLINKSLVPSEPLIILENKRENVVSGFSLKNENTGITLALEKEILPNEKIIISIKNRTILSGTGENLLPFLDDTSYLHEFILAPGENLIKLTAEDGLECEIIYNINYTEAVI